MSAVDPTHPRYRMMVALMDKLIDEIGDRETHQLMGLLDIVTFFVQAYEERNIKIPNAEPREVLRFLMEQHKMRLGELAEVLGSKADVSKILSGERDLDACQARTLAERFSVSPEIFVQTRP